MTVPNDDGFVGASVTEDQFKQNLVQLLDHIRSLTSGFDLKNGKVYDFASMLDFEAIKTKIPAGSIVVIEWGEEYGAYVWDGANLTKSQYDLLALAKSDATAKAATAKSEAISAAATDATTKANNAEANAKNFTSSFVYKNSVDILKEFHKNKTFINIDDTYAVAGEVWEKQGTKTTGLDGNSWSTVYVPVKKGDIVIHHGLVGDASPGRQYDVLVQLDENKIYDSVLAYYTSTGAGVAAYASSPRSATATRDGYIAARINKLASYYVGLKRQLDKTIDCLKSSQSLIETGYYYDVDGNKLTSSVTAWQAFMIPVKKGEIISYAGVVGGADKDVEFGVMLQFDKSKNFVQSLATIAASSAKTLAFNDISATATQDGYIYVRRRYDQPISWLTKTTFDSDYGIDYTDDTTVRTRGVVYFADGTSTSAAEWDAFMIPCKKGDTVLFRGIVGSVKLGEDMMYIGQFDLSKNFIAPLNIYKSNGQNTYLDELKGTATQDGYIYVRARWTISNARQPVRVKLYTATAEFLSRKEFEINQRNVAKNLASQVEKLPINASNDYGYNFVPYAQNNVVEYDDYQYTVYVDKNRNPVILQRYRLGEWKSFDLSTVVGNPLVAPNIKDSHNCHVVTVTKDGYIIITGNHHNVACRAVISTRPHDISEFKAIKYTDSTSITYPRLLRYPDGTTQAFWREGSSGDGSYYCALFDDVSKTFLDKVEMIGMATTVTSNPYEQGIAIDSNGVLHACWGYRTTWTSANANFGMFYAKSADKGKTWTNASGSTTYTNPINDVQSEKIFNATTGSGYVNQNGGCADKDGHYHTAIFQYDVDGFTQIAHIWFDGTAWQSSVVTDLNFKYDLTLSMVSGALSRPLIASNKTGRTFIFYRTSNMGRENEIRAIDVTLKGKGREYVLANFDMRYVELAINTDIVMRNNEAVFLMSRGGGEVASEIWGDQSMFLVTATLPI